MAGDTDTNIPIDWKRHESEKIDVYEKW